VVEVRRRPGRRIVADRAGVAERRRRVNRVVRIIEIGLMTAVAVCRRAAVHAIRMAGCACRGYVSAGQWIVGLRAMVEARRRPGRRIVADRAGVAERRRRVNRVIRIIEIGLMTAVAV